MTEALTEYRRRQREPLGNRMVVVTQGRIWKTYAPSPEERRPCCDAVGDRSIPDHLRSVKHVANLYGLDPDAFTAYVRAEEIQKTRMERRQKA